MPTYDKLSQHARTPAPHRLATSGASEAGQYASAAPSAMHSRAGAGRVNHGPLGAAAHGHRVADDAPPPAPGAVQPQQAAARIKPALPQPSPVMDMLSQEQAELDFLLPGLLRATVGACIGPGGVGKSYWAMQLALSVACGVDLVGLRPKKGSVLYLSGEDAQVVHAQRLKAMTAGAPRGLDFSASLDLRVTVGQHVDIMDDDWFEDICAAAQGRDLVILDTLTRFHNLDENSSRDMKMLLARLESLAQISGAAVIFLHHTGKAVALAGLVAAQQAARGSSVLTDNARWSCFLAGMTEGEAKRFGVSPEQREDYVRWNISKQNYGASVTDVWFQRSAGGVLRTHTSWPKQVAGPLNELTKLPTDANGKPLAHVSSRGRCSKVSSRQTQESHQAVLARGINGESTLAERQAHAVAMAASRSGERMPASANNSFANQW